MLVVAILVVIAASVYVIPLLQSDSWQEFVSSCEFEGGHLNSKGSCVIQIDEGRYLSKTITGINRYCTKPTLACSYE